MTSVQPLCGPLLRAAHDVCMLPAAAPPTSAIKSLWIENQIYVTRLLAHWHRFCDNSSSGPVGPRQTIFLQQPALCVSNILLETYPFLCFLSNQPGPFWKVKNHTTPNLWPRPNICCLAILLSNTVGAIFLGPLGPLVAPLQLWVVISTLRNDNKKRVSQ